jgi:hypothetical protein
MCVLGRRPHGRGECAGEVRPGDLQIVRDGKPVVESRRVQERHLRAPSRCLAQAMRQNRRFAAQAGADDEDGILRFQVSNGESERGIQRILCLIAEILHAQAMVEVAGAEPAHEFLQEIQLFERRGG